MSLEKLPRMTEWEFYHPTKYSELRDLNQDVLLSDLYNIVMDYVLEVKDYDDLKKAFMADLINRLDDSFNALLGHPLERNWFMSQKLELWRGKILYHNTKVDVYSIICDDCHLKFRGNGEGGYGALWTAYSYWCHSSISIDHTYYLCFQCHYRVMSDAGHRKYDRNCQFH
jgi:hypothetical protein